MSLRDWVQFGWLVEHRSSREEIRNLLALADRDLRNCQAQGLDADWRFAIAYNAALQAASAALAAAPIGLVRNRRGPSGVAYALEEYVNDRPYAKSFYATARAGFASILSVS